MRRRDAGAPTEGKRAIRTSAGCDRDVAGRLFEQRHVNRGALAPQAEQRQAARGELGRERLPAIAVDLDARPRPVLRHPPAAAERVGEIEWSGVTDSPWRYPSNPATCWNQVTSGGGR